MNDNLGRNTVYPIREKKDLEDCFVYLRREIKAVDPQKYPTQYWIKTRNYYLVYLGINIGLRVSDLLRIKAKHIKDGFIQLREQKTGKLQQIQANKEVIREIKKHYVEKFEMDNDTYLFMSRKGYNKPMSRQNVSTIIKDIAKNLGWSFPVNTHTLRKTFGYHYYRSTNDVVGLQKMFNHSTPRTTLIYIGMIQEEVDTARQNFKINL